MQIIYQYHVNMTYMPEVTGNPEWCIPVQSPTQPRWEYPTLTSLALLAKVKIKILTESYPLRYAELPRNFFFSLFFNLPLMCVFLEPFLPVFLPFVWSFFLFFCFHCVYRLSQLQLIENTLHKIQALLSNKNFYLKYFFEMAKKKTTKYWTIKLFPDTHSANSFVKNLFLQRNWTIKINLLVFLLLKVRR
jgi:hypothetical protein